MHQQKAFIASHVAVQNFHVFVNACFRRVTEGWHRPHQPVGAHRHFHRPHTKGMGSTLIMYKYGSYSSLQTRHILEWQYFVVVKLVHCRELKSLQTFKCTARCSFAAFNLVLSWLNLAADMVLANRMPLPLVYVLVWLLSLQTHRSVLLCTIVAVNLAQPYFTVLLDGPSLL